MADNAQKMRELSERLAEIARTEKELKTMKDEAKAELLSLMDDAKLDTLKFASVTVSMSSRKTWTYSKAVAIKEEMVKELKAKEQEDGTASFTEEKSLAVRTFEAKAE